MDKVCVACDSVFDGNVKARFCSRCDDLAGLIRGRAVRQTARKGKTHPTKLLCVDCGKRAAQYDHRHYAKPEVVDPVCRSCNIRRGPAHDLIALVRAEIAGGTPGYRDRIRLMGTPAYREIRQRVDQIIKRESK